MGGVLLVSCLVGLYTQPSECQCQCVNAGMRDGQEGLKGENAGILYLLPINQVGPVAGVGLSFLSWIGLGLACCHVMIQGR